MELTRHEKEQILLQKSIELEKEKAEAGALQEQPATRDSLIINQIRLAKNDLKAQEEILKSYGLYQDFGEKVSEGRKILTTTTKRIEMKDLPPAVGSTNINQSYAEKLKLSDERSEKLWKEAHKGKPKHWS